MRGIIFLVSLVFFVGCTTKVVVKKQNPSVEMQKQNAKEEWRELDKE